MDGRADIETSNHTPVFSMRLSPELKEQLQRIANRERRSLTNLVEKVLVEFVEREKAVRKS